MGYALCSVGAVTHILKVGRGFCSKMGVLSVQNHLDFKGGPKENHKFYENTL